MISGTTHLARAGGVRSLSTFQIASSSGNFSQVRGRAGYRPKSSLLLPAGGSLHRNGVYPSGVTQASYLKVTSSCSMVTFKLKHRNKHQLRKKTVQHQALWIHCPHSLPQIFSAISCIKTESKPFTFFLFTFSQVQSKNFFVMNTSRNKKDKRKRDRPTPNSSLDSSDVQATKNIKHSTSMVDDESSVHEADADGNTSSSQSSQNVTLHSAASTDRDWSKASEDELLEDSADDSVFMENQEPKPTGSTPKITSSSSNTSFNHTADVPADDLIDQLEENRKKLIVLNITPDAALMDLTQPIVIQPTSKLRKRSNGMLKKRSYVLTQKIFCQTETTRSENFAGKSQEHASESAIQPPGKKSLCTSVINRVNSVIYLFLAKKTKNMLKFAITKSDYPSSWITLEQKDQIMEFVRKALETLKDSIELEDMEDVEKAIGFGPDRMRSGQVVIICNNRRSAVWLNKTIKHANAIRAFPSVDVSLNCIPIASAKPEQVFTLWHPIAGIKFEEVKKEMKRNQGLNAESWKLFHTAASMVDKNGKGGGIRFTFMGDKTLTDLFDPEKRTMQFKHDLLPRPIFVRWQKNESEEEQVEHK